MALRLYDTLTREKRDFTPIDPANVRMYVCGPTVYDFAHIGNARPVIVFDVLFRLLRHLYGADAVTYVRNITDVDDKINDRAARDFPGLPLNDAIRKVTEVTEAQFQQDATALGCLPPTHQPRATDFVLPRADGKTDMVTLIRQLIARGHAYEAGGEVLFDTTSMPDYGALSGRRLDEQQAGARIAVDAHKKHPNDFVLWKQSSDHEPGWDSPWGRGRPGWHIECSAMSAAYLGDVFDIHGGGLDLIFPHHENELAQSRCAHGTSVMANTWMHNGFLQVEGEKMSKSLGNFVTIRELRRTNRFGGRSWDGLILRFAMMQVHYRQPIDWTVSRLSDSEKRLEKWRSQALSIRAFRSEDLEGGLFRSYPILEDFLAALSDDLNTSEAIVLLDEMAENAHDPRMGRSFEAAIILLGLEGYIFRDTNYFQDAATRLDRVLTRYAIEARRRRNFRIDSEDAFALMNLARKIEIIVERGLPETEIEMLRQKVLSIDPEVRTFQIKRRSRAGSLSEIERKIADRTIARARKDFAESDRIRDELLAMGVVLKDGKDADGKPVTTWEIAR